MIHQQFGMLALLVTAATLASAVPAVAKEAVCNTGEAGDYPCEFTLLDEDGSFQIEAEGRPTFMVFVEAPGEAYASAIHEEGARPMILPGTYRRSKKDLACWVNSEHGGKICAW